MSRIAIGGSAANPPTIGHFDLARQLLASGYFDQVIWIPSGERPDKHIVTDPDHRVALTYLTFPADWFLQDDVRFIVKFEDVYGENTPTIEWLERLQKENPDAELVWYTGSDSVVPRAELGGRCELETWVRGPELMRDWKFLIIPRKGFSVPATLSSHFEVADFEVPEVSSSEVRKLIAAGEKFEHLVPLAVAQYIKLHGLYGWRERRR